MSKRKHNVLIARFSLKWSLVADSAVTLLIADMVY